MQKLLTILTVILIGLVVTPNTAEASIHLKIGSSHSYVSGRASCGCPIYTKRVVRGFDRYRKPIYSYYRQPFRCCCRKSYRSPVVRRSFSSGHSASVHSHQSSRNQSYINSRVRSTSRRKN